MGIRPDMISEKALSPDDQYILKVWAEAHSEMVKWGICSDLNPWVFRYRVSECGNDTRFVVVLNCSEGPFGEMILVQSCAEACRIFGNDLFDQKKEHFDIVTAACYQILLHEPCYIIRARRPKMLEPYKLR